ncbi:MAG: chromosomal replication initiator protein DnaA [Rhodospirillales bacterium]
MGLVEMGNGLVAAETADRFEGQWARVSASLREEIGEAAFQSWIKPMTPRGLIAGTVELTVPTRFMRDWVVAHYADRLVELWRQEDRAAASVSILVQSDHRVGGSDAGRSPHLITGRTSSDRLPLAKPSEDEADRRAASPIAASPIKAPTIKRAAGNLAVGGAQDISAPLDPRYTFEQFVVGKPNEFAHAAAQRVADATQVSFNPLFLYGGVGLGKTHLMHAIAWHIRERDPSRNVIYLSAEKFMYRFIRALREQNTVDFKEMFRSVDVLMIDDVQFIGGKGSTQEEFFHTFNALVDQGRQIVLSADKSPSDLEGMEERLISRLNCGLVADIHATTYELRLGILHAKAERLGVDLPKKVVEFIGHKITANVRELEGALNRVVAHAQLVGRDITLESAQEVLHDLLRANDRRVTIEDIQKSVASHFNIRLHDMQSARRARAVARPRQVAMYLAKQLTSRSLPEIGRKFGGRDHTTVMHAVKKVEELRERDHSFNEDVELLRRMLEG